MSNAYTFNPDEILSPDEEVIHEQNKIIERLQEQLKDANEVIKWYAQPDTGSAKDYLEKWGVK